MTKCSTLLAACLAFGANPVLASSFKESWTLHEGAYSLTFATSVLGGAAEVGSFQAIDGMIAKDGSATLSVSLDSVATGDDLWDARLRFLLFESFRRPSAQITAQIDPVALAGLKERRSVEITLPITLELNDHTGSIDTKLDVALLTDDIVSVSTVEPIQLDLSDFNLLAGLEKLEGSTGLKIVPRTDVEFELLFSAETTRPAGSAGEISLEACAKRIATIAGTDQVYFTSGSAELESKSFPLLDAIADTIHQCDGLEVLVEGHTDDRGSDEFNLELSDRRAAAVVTYLAVRGIPPERLRVKGYGEARPIADNNTRKGRWKNRRIEFTVPGL